MGWVAVGLSVLYWVIESVMDSYLYGLGSLTSRLMSPDINETMMRLLFISLLLGFGFYARTIIDRLSRTETMLNRMNDCFLHFGPDPDKNIHRLTELAGELLDASAALYHHLDRGILRLRGHWGPLKELNDHIENPQGRIFNEAIENRAGAVGVELLNPTTPNRVRVRKPPRKRDIRLHGNDGGVPADFTTTSLHPRIIRRLDSSPYAETDPWIRTHGFKTYFGQAVCLGTETVGSLCAFFDRNVTPGVEEVRLTGIIASAIGVEEVRRLALKKIEDSERQLRLLSARLMSAQETERKHIAMQLHDSVGQSLSAVKFSIEESLERLKSVVPSEKLRPLESAVPLIQDVMRELRAMLKTLRPAMLDDLGILATINWLCREVETIYEGVTVERQTDLDEEEIPAALKVPIFRILQEAMNNAVKHSRCDRIQVELSRSDGGIRLEVRDNGRGFPSTPEAMDAEDGAGMGLTGMRERAELSGGRFQIESRPGEGTRVCVRWPVSP